MEHFLLKNNKPIPREEEATLTQAYKDGDQDASVKLLQSQGLWIKKLVMENGLPSGVELDDVLSDITLALLKVLPSFDPGKSSFSTFVARFLRWRLPYIIRKLVPPCESTDEMLDKVDESKAFEQTIEELDDVELVWDIADAKLSESQVQILVDYLNGYPIESIAARAETRCDGKVGYNPKNVLTRIEQAKETIRATLVQMGIIDKAGNTNLLLF